MVEVPDEPRAKLQKVALEADRASGPRLWPGRHPVDGNRRRLRDRGQRDCYLEKTGEFAVAAENAGIVDDDLIGRIVTLAVERHAKAG